MAQQTAASSRERQHPHRCPVCDRLKRVVRANIEQLDKQMKVIPFLVKHGVAILDEKEVWALYLGLWEPLCKIEQAISAKTMKEIGNLPDNELQRYIREVFNPDGSQIALADRLPDEAVKPAVESVEKPKLTLIKGGKQNEEVTDHAECH